MKKIYTLALLLAGGMTLNAQQPGNVNPGPSAQHAARTVRFDHSIAPTNRITPANPTTQAFSGWISYADSKDNDWGGGVSELNANYLFPDSTVLGNYGTYDYVWIHNIGDVLDVAAPTFSNFYPGYNVTRTDAYSIDSMAIVYVYDRQLQATQPGVVDTLIVYLYNNSTAANLQANGFIGATAANYATDTVGFKGMKYNGAMNMPSNSNTAYGMPSGMQTFKIPLTISDTTVAYYGVKYFNTNNFQVPAGKFAAASFVFKPGYTYTLGDTLDNMNYFLFASMEEGGGGASGGSFPLYLDCNYQSTSCDYNCSFIVRTNERYSYPGNGWNGYFIPKYAFTQAYSLENHYVYYKISSPPMSVTELEQTGLSLGQNMPNPTNGNTTIKYSIADGGHVVLNVFDVTGKQVMSFDQGRQTAGDYQVEFNTNNLQAGVYFYTLNVDGKQATRRMVVAE